MVRTEADMGTVSAAQPQRIGPRELLILVSAIMALMALGLDLMLPAFDDVRDEYGLADGSAEVGQVITIYFFGMAIAQIVYGPLADRFGRKPILYAGIALYLVGAVGSAVATSFQVMLISRFVWGSGAAGARVVAQAVIRDRFEGVAMAKALSQVMAVFVLVPVVAPTLGAGLIAILPWRSVFWACVVWAVIITLWSLRLRETLNPADQLPLGIRSSLSAYRTVLTTPVTFGYTIAGIFLQGVFTTYLASSEAIISEIYGRENAFPFVFGAIAAMFGVAAVVNGRIVERFGIDGVIRRVFVVLVPLVVVLLALAFFGNGRPPFFVFMPLVGLGLSGFMFLLPNLNSAAMEPVGAIAGSASALSGGMRMGGGAVLGGIATAQIDLSVTPFAIMFAVMVACALVTVALVQKGIATRNVGAQR